MQYGLMAQQIQSIDFDLLEKTINEYYAKAHAFYLNSVKDSQLDYGIYHNIFFVLTEMVEARGCIKDDLISRFSYGIVKYSLTNKENLVREYFEKNPIGCYCPLLKQILGSKYVAQNSGTTKEQKGNNCHAILTDEQKRKFTETLKDVDQMKIPKATLIKTPIPKEIIASIASFANQIRLFSKDISTDEVKAFLYNEECARLRMNQNNLVAFFLYQLSKQSLIKAEWANIIACNGLLISSSGNIVTEAHNLTVPACKIANKPLEALKDKEKLIYDFVKNLKF
ncbi:hypothetical protein Premu_1436 [Hallella multisaccharivorax DSM 17128]|uniref:Uncharacterized protein n=2 Tax=Hallella multisaccharivorax TaxID=310514 RepID=F8NAV8_9BACT|nr:hypothetical protein Premu_1436 [Hallella multisaccharivorax DSM 17128]